LPDKSVPAPKKYETIFKKGTFPCLFNGNPEEKDGAVYYPKFPLKKVKPKMIMINYSTLPEPGQGY